MPPVVALWSRPLQPAPLQARPPRHRGPPRRCRPRPSTSPGRGARRGPRSSRSWSPRLHLTGSAPPPIRREGSPDDPQPGPRPAHPPSRHRPRPGRRHRPTCTTRRSGGRQAGIPSRAVAGQLAQVLHAVANEVGNGRAVPVEVRRSVRGLRERAAPGVGAARLLERADEDRRVADEPVPPFDLDVRDVAADPEHGVKRGGGAGQ